MVRRAISSDRRSFLKTSAVAAATAAGLSAAACDIARLPAPKRGTALDDRLLNALAEVVLPGEMGATGRDAAVSAFRAWLTAYEPAAEGMHGYGDQEITYLPADPGPAWNAQLAQLDAIARKRHGTGFAECDAARRDAIVRGQLAHARGGPRLPSVTGAPHVALALLAHWADSPAATDFVYGASIGKETCRQLAVVTASPARGKAT